MISKQQPHIKRAQKESLILKELSRFFMQITMDEPQLRSLFINRVKLSPDKSMCTVFFYTQEGESAFDKLMSILLLYKPSLRKALSSSIPSRYTPELTFKYDRTYEKQKRIEDLLEKIKEDDQL
ncbi:MAG TPA: ribosome-binding factor A [Candidatus Babeliales bacterium]|nr:ribosome-binding factor A [Candidatus Babeliales bacterium]